MNFTDIIYGNDMSKDNINFLKSYFKWEYRLWTKKRRIKKITKILNGFINV